jgi:hypothetical protein
MIYQKIIGNTRRNIMAKRIKFDRSGPTPKTFHLVKYNDNWADEMDLDGFRLMERIEYKEFVKDIKAIKSFPLEVYFGTNQFVIFESVEDIMKSLKFETVTEDEFALLTALFPQAARWGYGMFPEFEDYGE